MIKGWRGFFPAGLANVWMMAFGFIFIAFLARVALIISFSSETFEWSLRQWGQTVLMGARFDARLAMIILIPFWLASLFPWTYPWSSLSMRHPRWTKFICQCWAGGLTFIFLLLAIVYMVDAGNMKWFRQRVNFQTLSLARDWREAFGVISESYPVAWIAIFLMGVSYLMYRAIEWVLRPSLPCLSSGEPSLMSASSMRIWNYRYIYQVTLILVHVIVWLAIVHGAPWRGYSLRWSDVATLSPPLSVQLAQNPIQTIVDSAKYSDPLPSLEAIAPHRQTIQQLYGVVPAMTSPIFLRHIPINAHALTENQQPWNVVVVLMESLAHYKTGLSGNPLNPTPTIDALAHQGIYFSQAFTTYENTARAIFTVLTAMPDVERRDFSTRNPGAARQHLLMNEFTQHQRYYFLGGDPAFANIRGLLSNIKEGHVEDMFTHPSQVLGAWGVPDHTLMLNAHQAFDQLAKDNQPFVAVIQLASHHEPHLIPEDIRPLLNLPVGLSKEQYKHAGFDGAEEFASLVYSDYAVKMFMSSAQTSSYFNHTIFAFIGDHGIAGNGGDHALPFIKSRELKLENRHVPWIIYIPSHPRHQTISYPVSQMDMFPTLMGLAGIPYRHTTLGRDVLDSQYQPSAFMFTPDPIPELGWLENGYYFIGRADSSQQRLYSLSNAKLIEDPIRLKAMAEKSLAFYSINRYLLTHNLPLSSPSTGY